MGEVDICLKTLVFVIVSALVVACAPTLALTPVPLSGAKVSGAPTLVPETSMPAASTGTVIGTVVPGSAMLMLVGINDIQGNGTISMTMRSNLVVNLAQGEFALKDVLPGQYCLMYDPILIALVRGQGQGEIRVSAGPFS